MNILNLMKFGKVTNDCPNCGSDKLGTNDITGEHYGKLMVETATYYRSCVCGFEVTLIEGMEDKQIKERIAEALDTIN